MTLGEDKSGKDQAAVGARGPLTVDAYLEGVRAGDRAVLARAITLIESSHPERRRMAAELLQRVLPFTGGAWRIGVTGAPGVGKSTTIDQFGINLIEAGHKVAVLAVDPSSTRTGGSILGDKTRMERLSRDERAFIRPSPSSGALGGVARATRETMALCEAAGFDVVIVETVGVGQSETAVAGMVDFFLVLLQPGAGDDLQGIKKGVAELADMIVINKADGGNEARANITAADYRAALHILTPQSPHWRPPVITISAVKNMGLDVMWEKIAAHRETLEPPGAFEARRAGTGGAMDARADRGRHAARARKATPGSRRGSPQLEAAVRDGRDDAGAGGRRDIARARRSAPTSWKEAEVRAPVRVSDHRLRAVSGGGPEPFAMAGRKPWAVSVRPTPGVELACGRAARDLDGSRRPRARLSGGGAPHAVLHFGVAPGTARHRRGNARAKQHHLRARRQRLAASRALGGSRRPFAAGFDPGLAFAGERPAASTMFGRGFRKTRAAICATTCSIARCTGRGEPGAAAARRVLPHSARRLLDRRLIGGERKDIGGGWPDHRGACGCACAAAEQFERKMSMDRRGATGRAD